MVHVFLTVGPKGQVVIPNEYRKKFHLSPGDKVVLDDDEERLVLRPARPYGFLEIIKTIPKQDLGRMDPHEAYDGQMRHRAKKTGLLK